MILRATKIISIAILFSISGCGGGEDNTSAVDEVNAQDTTSDSVDEQNLDADSDTDSNTSPDGEDGPETGTETETDQTGDDSNPNDQSGTDNSSDADGSPEFAGILQVFDNLLQPTGNRVASFAGGFYRVSDLEAQFPDTLEFFDNVNIYPAGDECNLTVITDLPPTISSGEVITLTGNTGTIASLTRQQNMPGLTDYTDSTNSIDGITNLQFDIPGDQFPAFANIPVPDSISLSGSSPAFTSTVTADTVFRWTPGNPGVTHMSIGMTFGEGTSNRLVVGCFIADDGEFSIPQNLRSQIGTAVATGWTLDRRHIMNVQNDTSIVQVQRYTFP